mmetsp:Transcript_28850/g.43037  ORF Transcript_28850/g.43037 Transcript_28850/m.43037 type:complete len:84 (+) Transcript_28850:739-990(+)
MRCVGGFTNTNPELLALRQAMKRTVAAEGKFMVDDFNSFQQNCAETVSPTQLGEAWGRWTRKRDGGSLYGGNNEERYSSALVL